MTTALVQEQSKEPDRSGPNRHTPGVRILLVEDDRALASVVAAALTAAGHHVSLADGGPAALAADPADRVFHGRQLPDLDGREVWRRHRSQLPDLPIIIV